jgi:hypothetical protein
MRTALLMLLLAACADGGKSGSTERERDSAIGASQLPGAAGVRGAMRAGDSAAARNAQVDSVEH